MDKLLDAASLTFPKTKDDQGKFEGTHKRKFAKVLLA